jgi:hypothetical protein
VHRSHGRSAGDGRAGWRCFSPETQVVPSSGHLRATTNIVLRPTT